MLRKWWWVGALGLSAGALLAYAWLFLLSMDRHGWTHDHLTVLLFLWQTQTAAAFALLAALIGAATLLNQTQEAQRREEAQRQAQAKNLAIRLAVLLDAFGRACNSIEGTEPPMSEELPKLPPYPEDSQGWVSLDIGLATRCLSLPIEVREIEDLLRIEIVDRRYFVKTLQQEAARLGRKALQLAEALCRRYEIRDEAGNLVASACVYAP